MRQAILVVFTMVATALAGCASTGETKEIPGLGPDLAGVIVPKEVRQWVPDDVVWDTSRNYSIPLNVRGLEVLPAVHQTFESTDGVLMDTAVWRPNVPENVKVPVILDVGPYYADSISDIGGVDSRENLFFIDGFVKNGYAYGRVAIRGTSTSGGCMEFFSLREQLDVDEAVTYFGTQPWSNGNVALYGASYDGTTPWMAAQYGNPHLKTIVPVSGLTDIAGLMFRNGTNEVRGEIMHSGVYWPFGFESYRQPEDIVANAACPEAYEGLVAGPWTSNTGDRGGIPAATQDYWAERDFRENVKKNYAGSVYLVHGLQDWNVEGSMAYPFVNELEANGIPVKHMLGQWGHDWPDRKTREDHVRWDWAELLLRWFDQELKGESVANIGAPVDVEDNYNLWRTELTWPPRDIQWTPFHLGSGQLSTEETPGGEVQLYDPGQTSENLPSFEQIPVDVDMRGVTVYEATTGPLEKDLRFAGLTQLHATFVPTSPEGSRVYAELINEEAPDNRSVVAHAVMDLRYYQGGWERQDLVPGQDVLALMEFFPADVLIPAGNQLVLRITAGNANYGTQEHPAPTPITLRWGSGQSQLRLPVIERDVGDGKYVGQPPIIEIPGGGGGLPIPVPAK